MQELWKSNTRSHRGQGYHRQFPRLRGKGRDQSRSHIRGDRRGADAPRLLRKSRSHTTLRSQLDARPHTVHTPTAPSLGETSSRTTVAPLLPATVTRPVTVPGISKSVWSRDARVS